MAYTAFRRIVHYSGKRLAVVFSLLSVSHRETILYYAQMIKSFKHKGLEKFFTTGTTKGIQPNHASRLEERLQALHTAMSIDDMDLPGWRLHPLKGDRSGLWAVNVSGNWGFFAQPQIR